MMRDWAIAAPRTVDFSNEMRSRACSPVSQHGPRCRASQRSLSPLNSLTASPSEHQRMNETCARTAAEGGAGGAGGARAARGGGVLAAAGEVL